MFGFPRFLTVFQATKLRVTTRIKVMGFIVIILFHLGKHV